MLAHMSALESVSVCLCAYLRVKADNLESEWKAAKGTSISEQSGGDHADSADDEADPPRPLCRVEIGKRTALIKGDVDIELTFNKIMAAIPDLRRFKRFVLKEIATAVNYDETRCIFVYTKWDVEPPDDDHASLSTNYVIMRVRILQSSHLQHINAHHPRRIRSAPGTTIFASLCMLIICAPSALCLRFMLRCVRVCVCARARALARMCAYRYFRSPVESIPRRRINTTTVSGHRWKFIFQLTIQLALCSFKRLSNNLCLLPDGS